MIYFNGRPVIPAKNMRLDELLRLMEREASRVVVTAGGKFVPVSDYKTFLVPDGMLVEARELLEGG
ncbi:MAG: hypothetical protein COT18_11730 [Elusimicrobia bacterium CG08_land_8_20_14_0_20_59_10]|nr:MAG: hypothetical protein COT18_11730 [Elusimicrobia bacterium CG08_land_8_20_14_0_20_59_10]